MSRMGAKQFGEKSHIPLKQQILRDCLSLIIMKIALLSLKGDYHNFLWNKLLIAMITKDETCGGKLFCNIINVLTNCKIYEWKKPEEFNAKWVQ